MAILHWYSILEMFLRGHFLFYFILFCEGTPHCIPTTYLHIKRPPAFRPVGEGVPKVQHSE